MHELVSIGGGGPHGGRAGRRLSSHEYPSETPSETLGDFLVFKSLTEGMHGSAEQWCPGDRRGGG